MRAPQLGSAAIKGALEAANCPPEYVQEVLFGNVCQAGVGQAPARQASMGAGLPQSTVATTVNKVCASGMKTVSMAAMGIAVGMNDIVVAGGMESMSNVPYLIEKARFGGYRYGNGKMVDCLVHDGLWDPYGDHHVSVCPCILNVLTFRQCYLWRPSVSACPCLQKGHLHSPAARARNQTDRAPSAADGDLCGKVRQGLQHFARRSGCARARDLPAYHRRD